MRHYPKGSRYTAIEKNVLKLRAFEMVLVVFRVQRLRTFVLESVRATEELERDRVSGDRKGALTEKEVWERLVEDGVLSDGELREVRELIDYRNLIAHETERLTVDVNRGWSGNRFVMPDLGSYEPEALRKLDRLEQKIDEGIGKKYILTLSFAPLMFEPAERAYREEIDRLRAKIKKQALRWQEELDEVNATIASLPRSLLDDLQPGHPDHRTRSGTLSPEGIDCCNSLFNAGASPLGVAYLMRISLRSAQRWYARSPQRD